MKSHVFSLGRVAVALLLFGALAACVPPTPQPVTDQEGALSVDDLLSNLDALQGSAARSLSPTGMTVFTTPGGAPLSLQDLAAYLNGIKKDLGDYVKARTNGKPYLVVPVRLSGSTRYPSADANGYPLLLSGLMWVPFTWGRHLDAPLISFQHGTQVFRACAPSKFDANPLSVLANPDLTGALQSYVECIVAALMASAGYIVVMPDYPGFGDSTAPHPYVQKSLGNSVRDLVLAANAMLGGGRVAPNGKIFLTGYSEGGYATMAGALALQAVGITIAATVPCDGAYDLSGVMLAQMTTASAVKVPSYLLYAASGYKAAYLGTPDDFDYGSFLQSDYVNLLTNNNPFDGNHTNAQIDSLGLPTIPTGMLTMDVTTTPPRPPETLRPGGDMYRLLAANNSWVGWMRSLSPVVFVHCPYDDVVPYTNAQAAAAALAGLAPVYIQDVPAIPFISSALGSTHVGAFPTAMLAAFTAIENVNKGP